MVGPDLRGGVGWLKTLVCRSLRRLRKQTQHSNIRPSNRSAPITEPTTIPAMAPPERPEPLLALAAAPVAEGVLLAVVDGNNGGIDDSVGKVTPWHRLFTFDPIQHESVAFGELDAQYPQSPCRFEA